MVARIENSSKKEKENVEKKKILKEGGMGDSIVGFLLSFLIGGVIVVIFLLLLSFFHFSKYPELDFWIKAVTSLVMAALILKVGNIINPKETNVSKAVPYTLITLFFAILIWHYGIDDRASSAAPVKPEIVVDEIEEHVFLLNEGEMSPWVDFLVGYKFKVFANKGQYHMFYSNGQSFVLGNGTMEQFPDPQGDIKIRFKATEDGQRIIFRLRRI